MKSLKEMNIAFIGGGNMAEAIIKGLLAKGAVNPERVLVSDPSADRRHVFEHHFKTRVAATNARAVASADAIVLAVKPQFMEEALKDYTNEFREDQLVISIAAGIPCSKIDSLCGGRPAVIRVMPNTPALVGEGVAALCKGPRATDGHLAVGIELFDAVGTTLTVDEPMMDAVTSISGSGPAYVFYVLEAMLAAAREAGFDEKDARKLVYGTFRGSVTLACNTDDQPGILRERVTSKGGTTEAALAVLNDADTAGIIRRAVKAAADRSRELSGS